MPKTDHNITRPFSLRLTLEERAQLEKRAGSRALGHYIRECLFAGAKSSNRVSRGQFPVKDRTALAQVLALFGISEFGAHLTGLARAARIGVLPVTEETEAQLQRACADIAAIKSLIMKALGIKED